MKISKAEREAMLAAIRETLARSVSVSSRKRTRKSAGGVDVDGLKPEDVSFTKYLRRAIWPNRDWGDDELEKSLLQKALSQDSGTAGGFFVPPVLSDQLIERLKAKAVVRSLPGVKTVTLANTDKLEFNRVGAGPSISWSGEGDTLTEDTTMAFERVTLELHKATCLYKISRDLLENAGPQLDELVRQEIADEMAIEEDKVLLQGTGGKQPLGIYYHPGVLNTDLSGTISVDDLKDAIYQVAAQNARLTGWVCHPRTVNTLVQLKDGSSRYILNQGNLIGSPGLTNQQVSTLLGLPLATTTQISTTNRPGSSESYMVGGQWDQLIIGEKPGLRIETSSERYFDTDEVGLKVVKYVGYVLRHPEAFVVIKGIQA